MTKAFNTVAFQDLTSLWDNQTSDPNSIASVGALGSVWVRNGTSPTSPTEIFLKLSAADVAGNRGWVKQNLWDLKILNVTLAPFSVDPTGVANAAPGVIAAVAAAQAVGGGIIYFPPGTYNFFFNTTPGATAIIALNNKQNLVFMGDGYNTLFRVTGDFGGATQYLFELRNQTKRIRFFNFRMNGQAIVNPNVAAQNHYIQMSDAVASDVAPPQDVEITQLWFEPIIGDGVRTVGDAVGAGGRVITDVRVNYNMFNMGDATRSRSNVECSRSADKYQVHFNWMGTIAGGGQNIDFEPGGTAPNAWSIVGNIIATNTPIAVTLSGVDTPTRVGAKKNLFARNILKSTPNGATLEAVADPTNLLIKGNIITIAGDSVNINVIEIRNLIQSEIVDNILYSLDNTNKRSAIYLFADSPGNPRQVRIAGNVCGVVCDASTMVGLRFESCNQIVVAENMLFQNCAASAAGSGVQLRSIDAVGADWLVNHNMFIATAGTFIRGVDIKADPLVVGNVSVNGNLIHTVASGVVFDSTIAAITGFLGANDNVVAGATVATVTSPATNVGVKIEGNPGPGPNTAQAPAAPNGNVTGWVGALSLNTAGSVDNTLFYKETGAGTNTGWIPDGPIEIVFGAQALTTTLTSRFIAPGSDLAADSATEIKWAITRECTIRNLRYHATPGTGGGIISYFVRKNGVDTTLQMALANTSATGTGNSGAPTFVAGDLISIRIAKAATQTTPPTNVNITLEIVS